MSAFRRTPRGVRPNPARWVVALLAVALLAGACSGHKDKATKPKPADPARIDVAPGANAADVSPARPVTVTASGGALESVALTKADGTPIQGTLANDKKSWSAAGPLEYGTTYSVSATARNGDGKESHSDDSFTTVTPRTLTAATLFPTPATGDVGVGQPVDVRFDEPVLDKAAAEKSMSVKSDPAVEGTWHWIDDKEARWRPKDYWPPGTKVTVDVNTFGLSLGDGVYGQANQEVNFTIHDSWIAEGNINTHRLTIYHNGQLVQDFPASFGRPKYPTHDGVHIVQSKSELVMMNSASFGLPADSPDGYSNFPAHWATRISNDGEFVHANDGTTYSQGRANVTHGCVNLTSERARWFFDNINQGDVVKIVGGTPTLPVPDGYGDWNVPWDVYVKGSAL